jgi:hypothetical protein
MNTDVRARDLLTQPEIMAQAAENCTRLASALLKMRRVLDDTNPAGTSFARAADKVNEEYAAVMMCMKQLSCIDGVKMMERMYTEHANWIGRLIHKRNEEDRLNERT